jgi:hypothetical protein
MIFYKLATCISWAVFSDTIGGQHRQVSLYWTNMLSVDEIFDMKHINIEHLFIKSADV